MGRNADLGERVAIATDALPWTPLDGAEGKLLELAAGRRTALVRLAAGAVVPVSGASWLDVLVLAGDLREARARHGAGTYLRVPAAPGLVSPSGCTLLVKQRPGRGPRASVELARAPLGPPDAQGVALAVLHEDDGARVGLLRFLPGAAIGPHRHARGEEFFVLDGELRDEHGVYRAGAWVRQPAGSVHAAHSPAGCRTFVLADHLA